MQSSWGSRINLSLFGESHGKAIGVVIQGLKPGIVLDLEAIEEELQRRMPGKNLFSTQRKESDTPQILSGVFEGKTTGTALSVMFYNEDKHSKDYRELKGAMRPGHADYPGYVRYQGYNDYRGGGHFSGRLTAPIVFAGALAKQVLQQKGIRIGAHITQIGPVKDKKFDPLTVNSETFKCLKGKTFPVLNVEQEKLMADVILSAREEGDSIGGKIECAIVGMPAGIGSPFFDSLESTLAHLAFSIPAVKGISFGVGEDFATLKGSEANDTYQFESDVVKTKTNHNGGITGGISNGMPIVFEVVIKPTPSISKPQATIDVLTKEEKVLVIQGRHDPCIVQRAVVVIEAIAALAMLEHLDV